MIKTLIILIFVVLYLWVGTAIFYKSLEHLGGKEAYLREIQRNNNMNDPTTYFAYFLAFILVVLIWPYFVVMGVIKK